MFNSDSFSHIKPTVILTIIKQLEENILLFEMRDKETSSKFPKDSVSMIVLVFEFRLFYSKSWAFPTISHAKKLLGQVIEKGL